MDPFDYLLRGAAMAVALSLIPPFWRARKARAIGWAGAALFAAVAAYHFWRVAAGMDLRPFWQIAPRLIAALGPFFFWVLTRLYFEDGFRWRPAHWTLAALLAGLSIAAAIWPGATAIHIALRATAGLIMLHALWLIGAGAGEDLVGPRMRQRVAVLAVAAVAGLAILARPLSMAAAPALTQALERASPLLGVALMLLAARTFLRVEVDWPKDWPKRAPPPALTETSADPDADALARLDRAMGEEQLWREPGLTIGDLAQRLGLPEYRLRRLINERRGARNFTAYLAGFRLAAAARLLAGDGRAPISQIAYDVGYASLGPFNRALRECYGVTPTAYRKGERAIPADLSPIPEISR